MQDRLESLEKTVANLARDLKALRAVVDRLDKERDSSPQRNEATLAPDGAEREAAQTPAAAASVSSAAPPEAPPQPWYADPAKVAQIQAERRETERREAQRRVATTRRKLDLESLIGRYGTLALASLTILLGAGAFLSWAIANGKIGPEMRVFLGALGAAAVAVIGWRLRARGSMRFGSTLLALSLALVHVDAWGAGPYLKLVPSPVALGIAAAASVALAVLAWFGDEEALFSVGVGGALIAPFVTAREPGSTIALLAYGYVVLVSGLAALRGREWRTAMLVTTAGCWLYVATASATTLTTNYGVNARDYPAVFAIAVAWTAFVVTGGAWGARIARSALTALIGTLAAQVFDRSPATDLLILAAVGTATAYAIVGVALAGDRVNPRQPLFTGAVIPIALGAIAIVAANDTATARTLVALGWTAAAAAAAYFQPKARATHVMVGGIASGAALLFALEDRAVESCIALSAHAAALSILLRRIRTRLLGVPIAIGLAIVTVWTFHQLLDRPEYQYTPFLTAPSLAALAMSAAWLVVSWNAYRAELVDSGPGTAEARTAVRLAGSAVTFMWGHAELSHAYSSDVSTFLLILYYALVGVAAIFIGRARGIRVLRHVGLALAIFAALKAIAEASSLAIGIRVGSYFLAGLFLLAVAYWYRDRESVGASDRLAHGNGESKPSRSGAEA